MSWSAVALVSAGGAAGCALRYLVGVAVLDVSDTFPWSTLGVNVVGSFVLGTLLGALPPEHVGRLLFGTGFCGGFTTFSTFSVEVVALAGRGEHGRAGTYLGASVILSVLAAAAGAAIGRSLGGSR